MRSAEEAPTGSRLDHLVTLARDVGVYGFGASLIQIVGVLTVPIFARQLGAAEYGRLELLVSVTTLIVAGFGEAVGSGTMRSWVDQRRDEDRRAVLSAGLALGLLLSAAGGVIVLLLRPVLGADLEAGAVTAAAAVVPVAILARFWADVFRAQRRRNAYLAVTITRGVVSGLLGVVLVLAWQASTVGVLLGLAIGSAGAALVGWALGGRGVVPGGLFHQGRPIFAFGLPLIPVAISGWSLMLSDRIVIARTEPATALGEYAVANRLMSVLLLVVYSFGTAWTPYALTLGSRDPASERRLRPLVLHAMLLAIGVVAVVVSALAPELISVLAGDDYPGAAPVVPVLAAGMFLFAIVPVAQTPLLLARRTKDMALRSVVAAIVNLIACILLVPWLGLDGAALASVVGFAVQAVTYFARGQQVNPARYAAWRVGTSIVLALAVLSALRVAVEHDADLGVRIALAAAYPLAVLVLRLVRPAELIAAVRRSSS